MHIIEHGSPKKNRRYHIVKALLHRHLRDWNLSDVKTMNWTINTIQDCAIKISNEPYSLYPNTKYVTGRSLFTQVNNHVINNKQREFIFTLLESYNNGPIFILQGIFTVVIYKKKINCTYHILSINKRIIDCYHINVIPGDCNSQYQPSNAAKTCKMSIMNRLSFLVRMKYLLYAT